MKKETEKTRDSVQYQIDQKKFIKLIWMLVFFGFLCSFFFFFIIFFWGGGDGGVVPSGKGRVDNG